MKRLCQGMRMKILYTIDNPFDSSNPYFREMIYNLQAIDSSIVLDYGIRKFWSSEAFSYDIIHIQFPHFLLKTGSRTECHTAHELDCRLKLLKSKNIKIVVTCHNLKPHYKKLTDENESYDIVYRSVDVIYHLGAFSLSFCEKKFPSARHKLLEHPVYDDLYTFLPARQVAYQTLKLSSSFRYILCLGAFRADEERALLIKLLKELNKHSVKVIAPSFFCIKFTKNPFLFFNRIVTFIKYKLLYKNIIFSGKSVPDELLPYYMSVADIALLQRVKILNSGSLPLNFYFGNVVVGPDVGNVGEILKKTGNPVFNVENTSTLKTAVDEAFSLYNTGYGEKNRRYALENWRISLIAQKQYMYYKELLHLTNINIGRGGVLNLPVQFPYNTEAA